MTKLKFSKLKGREKTRSDRLPKISKRSKTVLLLNTFHPSHYGFMPFKDSTAALSKFYEDISRARTSRQTALAVCLDIRSAYDSVWIDGLIYKLARQGLRGKLGRWIAVFLTNRSICIRWKSVFSDFAPCRRGVPQGSVLSPFLFMIFLADIFEILESGVYLLLYADDIILYALGDDPHRTVTKLQNSLDRLTQWCTAYQLSVSPEKSVAIDFSRRRLTDSTISLMGVALDWSPVIKILGVWFGRSLLFNHHFAYLRAKAFKRLNYIKAVASCSRGVHSVHMLKIVDSLIRSLLEYACPLFIKVCPSTLNSLEVIYNSALRVATGLPKCTPIPLLRREANASSLSSRFRCLTNRFLIRQLSLPVPPFPLQSSDNTGHLSVGVDEVLQLYRVDSSNILKFAWPPRTHLPPGLRIQVHGLPFQIASLPPRSVLHAWLAWRESIQPGTIIASDASKDSSKTAIAVYNDVGKSGVALLIPHINSIFTAEAIALYTALSTYITTSGHFYILTDSLSVLSALQRVSLRSPKIIIQIHNLLYRLLSFPTTSISLIWSPGHKGIPPNEAADAYARNGPYRTYPLNWVAPEDIASQIQRDWKLEKEYSWINSDYCPDFPHLTDETSFRKWTGNRLEDVWISRWRTRMWLTNSRLFRMNLTTSPLCPHCCVVETPDHVLLSCVKLNDARSHLFSTLNLRSNASYSDVLSHALLSRKGVSALVRFSSEVARN